MKTSDFNFSIKSFTIVIFLFFSTLSTSVFAQESSFQTPVQLNDGKATNIIDIKHVDFDMDGELDLVTASATEVRWYKGKGEGEFEDSELLIDLAIGGDYSELLSFDVGDIDADNDMDFIYVDRSNIVAFKNDGDLNFSENLAWKAFQNEQIFVTNSFVNGKPEIIISGTGNEFRILTDEDELIESRDPIGHRGETLYTDIDGDNENDIVILEEDFVGIYWGDNNSLDDIEHDFSVPELDGNLKITDAIVSDINNDGFNDIVFSIIESTSVATLGKNNGYLVYVENDANIALKGPILSSLRIPGYSAITASDINEDELPEIISTKVNDATGNTFLITIDSTSVFSEPAPLFEDNYYFDKLFSFDIDQDSLPDLVASSSLGDFLGWFRKKADGTFEDFRILGESLIPSPKDITELDVDGDDLNDIIVTSNYPYKALAWYNNSGDYEFEQGGIIENDLVNAKEIKLGDLNSDGAEDLILRTEKIIGDDNNSESRSKSRYHEFWWYKNQNNGSFSERIYIGKDTSYTGNVTLIDYNGDGNLDVVFSSTKLSVFTNDAIGEHFAKSEISGVDISMPRPSFSVSGDINGDLNEELITVSVTDSLGFVGPVPAPIYYYKLTVSSSDTMYSFTPKLPGRTYSITAAKTFDLDNDQKDEIIFTDGSINANGSANASIFVFKFDEITNELNVIRVDSSVAGYTGLAIDDFSGDGVPDLLVSEYTYSDHSVNFPYKFGGGITLFQNDGELAFRKAVQPDSLRIDVTGLRTANFSSSTTPEVISFSDTKEWILLYPSFNSLPVSTESGPYVPQSISLSQNYPNPFNPSTTIKYSIPAAGKVELKVYNLLGQLVQTLVDDQKTSGMHQIRFDASALASGVYIYQLKAADKVQTRKMILIK